MTFLYKYKDTVTTKIIADYQKKTVVIENYTDDILHRAFGVNEHPSFADFENFLESRCFPRTIDHMKLHLKELGISCYEPLSIIQKTHGRLEGDFMSLEIVRN